MKKGNERNTRMRKEWIAVLLFPGTTCAAETARAFEELGLAARIVADLHGRSRGDASPGLAGIVLPGGFAHADRPAPGVVAARSRAMRGVRAAARRGVPILGICNGFQILVAAGLLSGRLGPDARVGPSLRPAGAFLARNEEYLFRGRRVVLPIAHAWGEYEPTRPVEILLWRTESPGIAGVAEGRIWGLMPHPERAVRDGEGGTDGRGILEGFLSG